MEFLYLGKQRRLEGEAFKRAAPCSPLKPRRAAAPLHHRLPAIRSG
ncbi:hypothetical protein [Paenibacillus elgii]|nr:hypothetical protein [Paenibacillus elgii]NEN85253.1 hypothetical protein [Paenibacillus elgii]